MPGILNPANHLWLQLNKNENITYSYLWHPMKEIVRGKFVVLSAFIKNLGIPHISNLRIL